MADPLLDHDLAAVLSALERHDWNAAFVESSAFVGRDPLIEAFRLDGLAEAAWWLGKVDDCIVAREAAYRIFDELAEQRHAGQAAVWLWEHHAISRRPAQAGAWLRRARRALGDQPDCAELGALLLREAETAHGQQQFSTALDLASRCVEMARRLRSANLEAEGLQTMGRVLIDLGELEDGMRHLDEAMLFAVEGRLGPYSTGKVYCSLISACEEVGDLERASEWTDATLRWAEQHPFAIFPGICRVHRAAILKHRGSFAEAEREARKAIDELIHSHVGNAAAACIEIGDIRRRLGDLEGAEAAFVRAQELCDGQCGELALLRLAQGRVDAARSVVDRCATGTPEGSFARARILPASAQIAVAADDLRTARECVNELEVIAAKYGTSNLQAALAATTGRVLLAEGDLHGAIGSLRVALEAWRRLDVPYEAATTRTLLGQALRSAGDEAAALEEFAAAVATFDQLGARVGPTPATAPPLPCGLTEREAEVLGLVASGLTNREIAEALYLSVKTVSRHLSNIYTKIDVRTRAGATAFSFEHGLSRS